MLSPMAIKTQETKAVVIQSGPSMELKLMPFANVIKKSQKSEETWVLKCYLF